MPWPINSRYVCSVQLDARSRDLSCHSSDVSQLQSPNPLVPNWSIPARNGAFQRIHELIRSNYAATSRPSVMTAVRHWVRFCASLGITPFRPRVANDWDGKVTEEVIMMLFLEHLLFVVKVQGPTAKGYLSLMKGWHAEIMGYQPAASGIYTTV